MSTLSKPIAVRFDEDLVQLIEEVSAGQHMNKTDFIREAVLEKLEDMYDLVKAEKPTKSGLTAIRKLIVTKK